MFTDPTCFVLNDRPLVYINMFDILIHFTPERQGEATYSWVDSHDQNAKLDF